jgi:hypothetical protein
MVIRKASEDTDQLARSLLQKAIRRGNIEVATATFWHLAKTKEEFRWVRSRLAVLTFEEAWPYGLKVSFGRSESEILGHLIALCSIKKNKDAAGLGSLAYAFAEGDSTVLRDDDQDWYIRVVAKALKDKDKFRAWAQAESSNVSPEQAMLVANAIEGSKKAGWPWDKAFTYAAALFALKTPVPALDQITTNAHDKFPFWVAIDKHTQQGKETIRLAASQLNIPANTALWLSFYYESATCSDLTESPWWEREKLWRLSKLGIDETEASHKWSQLRPLIREHLAKEAIALESRVMQSLRPPLCGPKIGATQQKWF